MTKTKKKALKKQWNKAVKCFEDSKERDWQKKIKKDNKGGIK